MPITPPAIPTIASKAQVSAARLGRKVASAMRRYIGCIAKAGEGAQQNADAHRNRDPCDDHACNDGEEAQRPPLALAGPGRSLARLCWFR